MALILPFNLYERVILLYLLISHVSSNHWMLLVCYLPVMETLTCRSYRSCSYVTELVDLTIKAFLLSVESKTFSITHGSDNRKVCYVPQLHVPNRTFKKMQYDRNVRDRNLGSQLWMRNGTRRISILIKMVYPFMSENRCITLVGPTCKKS